MIANRRIHRVPNVAIQSGDDDVARRKNRRGSSQPLQRANRAKESSRTAAPPAISSPPMNRIGSHPMEEIQSATAISTREPKQQPFAEASTKKSAVPGTTTLAAYGPLESNV